MKVIIEIKFKDKNIPIPEDFPGDSEYSLRVLCREYNMEADIEAKVLD